MKIAIRTSRIEFSIPNVFKPAQHVYLLLHKETAELFLNGEKGSGVLHRGLDLEAVADDAGIREQQLGLAGSIAGDLLRLEVVEGFPVGRALFQDGFPAQAGLGAFEDEKFKEPAVVVDRHAPFCIVVTGHQLAGGPFAPALS